MDSNGYPRIKRDGRQRLAHRLAYEGVHGGLPSDCVVHHDCENKLCVNPEHLRAMTPEEHALIHDGDWQRARVAA